ncbi:MAG: lipopolysaccharide heptosyltransferase II [Gammaproteobacteria bacterium]|nr:lipopolysaccharide heptosyltransferase II [Gammaproteobacteria bacterium]
MSTAAEPKRYLVVGPSWVGDMVMAQALFKTLRQREANCVIDVIAPQWSLSILHRMPEVRRGIALSVGHGEFSFSVRRGLGKSLRQESYDQSIALPRSFKSALVPFFASAKIRTGYRGEMRYGLLNDIRPLNKLLLDQTVKRFVALGLPPGELLEAIPQPALTVDQPNQQRLCSELGLDLSRPIIAMMPGASYGIAKCWPPEYFSELAAKLTERGNAVWVLGGAGDKAIGEQVIAGLDSAKNLCGITALEDTVDLLALSAIAVSNDSGLMHVAAASGVHVIAMFGSSTPAYTPALTNKKTIHYLNLECSPCFKRECPLTHLNCLRNIHVDDVLTSVEMQLAATVR